MNINEEGGQGAREGRGASSAIFVIKFLISLAPVTGGDYAAPRKTRFLLESHRVRAA